MGAFDDLLDDPEEETEGAFDDLLDPPTATPAADRGIGGDWQLSEEPETPSFVGFQPKTEPEYQKPTLGDIWDDLVGGEPLRTLSSGVVNSPMAQTGAAAFSHGVGGGLGGLIPGEAGDGIRNMYRDARAEAPGVYDTVDAIGSLAMPGVGGGKGGVFRTAGEQGLEAAGQTAANALADSDTKYDSLDEFVGAAKSAGKEGLQSAAVAAPLAGVLATGGKVAQRMSDAAPGLEHKANVEQLLGWGATRPDIGAGDLTNPKATWSRDRIADEVAQGRLLGLPRVGTFEDAAGAADKAVGELDAKRLGLVSRAKDMGASPSPDTLADNIMDLPPGYGSGSEGQALGGEAERIANEMRAMNTPDDMLVEGLPPLTPGQKHAMFLDSSRAPETDVTDYLVEQPGSNWDEFQKERSKWRDKTRFDPTTNRGKVHRDVYGKINDTMEGAMNEVEPQLGTAWRDINKVEHGAIQARDWANQGINREAARGGGYLDTLMGAGLGLGGAAIGYQQGGATGALQGAAAGIGANALRKRAHGIKSVGYDALSSLGAPAGVGASAMRAGANSVGPEVAAGFERRRAQDREREEQRNASLDGKGHQLEKGIEDLLVASPQQLGRYRANFEAAGKRPGGIGAELAKLVQKDRVFRMQVLPKLQTLTRGAQ